MKNFVLILMLCLLGSAFAGVDNNPGLSRGTVLDGGNTHDWWFTPRIDGTGRAASTETASTTITNYADVITYTAELAPVVYTASYDVVAGDLPEEVRYFSVNGLFAVDEFSGVCESLATGADEILLRSASLERRLPLNASTTLPGKLGYQEVLEAHQYLAGSVKQHVNTNFAALVAGHDGSEADLAIYSVQDHAATNYVRNTNCWAAGLDLTCASPWNSIGAQRRAQTLILPDVMIASAHYHGSWANDAFADGVRTADEWNWNPAATNWTVRFVDATNGIYERTVVAAGVVIGSDESITNNLSPWYVEEWGATNAQPDYVLFRLGEPLPESIAPAARLPDNWMEWLPVTQGFTNELNNQRFLENYPIVMTDQQERATIGESVWAGLGSCAGYQSDYGGYLSGLFSPPTRYFQCRETFAPFYRDKIVGDSSSPMLLFVNGRPVLTGTLTTGFGGAAWVAAPWCAGRIQATAAAIGSTNVWQAADLSGFSTFERVD